MGVVGAEVRPSTKKILIPYSTFIKVSAPKRLTKQYLKVPSMTYSGMGGNPTNLSKAKLAVVLSEVGTHLRSERALIGFGLIVIGVILLGDIALIRVVVKGGVLMVVVILTRVFRRAGRVSGAQLGHEVGVLGVATLQLLLPAAVAFVLAVVLEIWTKRQALKRFGTVTGWRRPGKVLKRLRYSPKGFLIALVSGWFEGSVI